MAQDTLDIFSRHTQWAPVAGFMVNEQGRMAQDPQPRSLLLSVTPLLLHIKSESDTLMSRLSPLGGPAWEHRLPEGGRQVLGVPTVGLPGGRSRKEIRVCQYSHGSKSRGSVCIWRLCGTHSLTSIFEHPFLHLPQLRKQEL